MKMSGIRTVTLYDWEQRKLIIYNNIKMDFLVF
jgi:hypothetical protein